MRARFPAIFFVSARTLGPCYDSPCKISPSRWRRFSFLVIVEPKINNLADASRRACPKRRKKRATTFVRSERPERRRGAHGGEKWSTLRARRNARTLIDRARRKRLDNDLTRQSRRGCCRKYILSPRRLSRALFVWVRTTRRAHIKAPLEEIMSLPTYVRTRVYARTHGHRCNTSARARDSAPLSRQESPLSPFFRGF